MSRPVPPQVIPRPSTWRPGKEAPWAGLPSSERTGISMARVLRALASHGQRGPIPEGMRSEQPVGPPDMVSESFSPAARAITAAVLVTLFEEDGEARMILTRRAASLRSHRGEVSFPGGRIDPAEDPPRAALREAHEEIALDPAQVTMEGWIHPVLTVGSATLVMPMIGTVPGRPHVVASPAEVARLFDVALRDLADAENFHEEHWRMPGRDVPGSPDGSFPVWFFEVEGEMIWGATARMIFELLSVVLLPPA
jgi:8-oxo-dGTP pyrophosphatase MutT (NUDIX family)